MRTSYSLLNCTCLEIHPVQVEPALPIELTMSRMEALIPDEQRQAVLLDDEPL